MSSLLPPRFLFRYSFELLSHAAMPKKTAASLLGLATKHRLPNLSEMDDSPSFATVSAAWNAEGVGFTFAIAGKKQPIQYDPKEAEASDSIQVWIDTRNTKSIHRASKFCHHFALHPTGYGKNNAEPHAEQIVISNAREASPTENAGLIQVKLKKKKGGYQFECWFPKESLYGYDPESSPLIGCEFLIYDTELGSQTLGTSPEFPIHYNPSLWSTLELKS